MSEKSCTFAAQRLGKAKKEHQNIELNIHLTKNTNIMSAAQAIASSRFLKAMGPMIEDEKAMQQVLLYIGTLRRKEELPTMTMEEAEQHGMPLHQAMDKLREKARVFYQA